MEEQLQFGPSGRLFFGDNLEVMRRHITDESVDLVYLDPPFNSNRSFNLLFQHRDGRAAAGQVKAFDDTWTWSIDSARTYQELVERGDQVSKVFRAFREILGTNDMLAYLTMMGPRLIELQRVLKSSGSLYLHCDPTASHYLKVLLDAIFGPTNFRNEIAWHYSGWNKRLPRHFERRHDVILFYSRSKDLRFNGYALPWESKEQYLKVRKQKLRVDEDGVEYVLSDAGGGKRVSRYLEEAMSYGRPVDDVWDIDKLNNSAKEAVGYPTQKPLALLERIITASSSEGDVVLDPFCGCGTAIDAAQRLGRSWIGIDVTAVAIDIIRDRLAREYLNLDYVLTGEPSTMDEAIALAALDKFEFQAWAARRVGVPNPSRKKGADRGIDGRLAGVFENGESWEAIVQVKGGRVTARDVRDLHGTVGREGADFGVFVSLHPFTKAMVKDAVDVGITSEGVPRLQLLTVSEVLDGAMPALPDGSARPARVVEERRLRAV
jgi:site-specific DNA-methyltransferase (adenine-specific)